MCIYQQAQSGIHLCFIFCHFWGQTSIIIPMHVLFKKSHYEYSLVLCFYSSTHCVLNMFPPRPCSCWSPLLLQTVWFLIRIPCHICIQDFIYLQKNPKTTIVLITCVILESGSFSVCQKKKECKEK